jgi:Dolichyl-phosphate-mannose-protein mannosyltransferase
LHADEGTYINRAMQIFEGEGPLPQGAPFYDHPYFGQIFLASVLALIGYPDSLNPSDDGDVHSIEMLYLVPRVLMGLLAIADTFLIYKIAERRYNRKVALIASILFAVMPYGWLFRRIFLETIQVPFLLTSILLAVYLKDTKIENNSNNTVRYRTIPIILLSGIFLGLSIFTKVPVFAMIPAVGFLIYTNNTNGHKLRNLGIWFIPVILIPLIWPAYAMMIGEFDLWLDGVLWQTTERGSRPLIGTINGFFEMDPVLFVLSMAGLIFAAVKRDFFLLLWIVPFLIFLYAIDYVSSFHLMPLVPAFCIAASRFLVEVPGNIIKKNMVRHILSFGVISGIIIFGLISTTMLISTNVNSSLYKTLAVIVQKLPNKDNTSNTTAVTLVGAPTYFWLPRYVLEKEIYDKGYYSGKPLETEKYIIVADRGFTRAMSGTDDKPPNSLMQHLYENSQRIATIVPDDKTEYNDKIYPYSNMKQNPLSKEIEIRSNY